MGGIFSIWMGDELTGRCWDCCGTQAAYMCRLESNLRNLQTTTRELEALKEDVERRVRVEEQQRMKRLPQVDLWFSRVDSALASAGELITDRDRQVHKWCLGGCCSKNCWSSCTFGRKIVKTRQTLVSLQVEGLEFRAVAEKALEEDLMAEMPRDATVGLEKTCQTLVSLQDEGHTFEAVISNALQELEAEDLVGELPCDPTVGLEKKLNEVWSCLFEADVGIVGLYGVGGVGKTTLLAQIHNKFVDTSNNFLIIWVVVSHSFTLERIQEEIGKMMGFFYDDWKQKTMGEKAQEIFNKLRTKKFVLFLDDIWQPVDLASIGVPLPGKLNGSKVIFTTRSMDVCIKMGAQRRIKVEALEWEQAWGLFEKNVGEETINFHPDIRLLAENVVEKCGGLALALITVGRAMSGKKEPQEWHHAAKMLRTPDQQLQEDEVLSLLKFSYDGLPSDKIRSCFLYCALFPADYELRKDDLVDYWICEDFGISCDDGSDDCNEGYSIINTLIGASLLKDENKYVNMHDLIRKMALRITKEKENTLVKAGRELKEAPKVETWEGVRRLSLIRSGIKKLPEVPTCPDLVSLLLCDNRGLYEISDDFFQFMGSLTVLDLSGTGLRKLPRSISNLVSLQYLNIGKTMVQELPTELIELRKLKYLNVSWLYLKAKKSVQLISNLSSLQVLRMLHCQYSYEGEIEGGEGDEELFDGKLLQELQCLKHLNSLDMTIRSSSALHRFVLSENLSTSTQQLGLQYLEGLKWLNIFLLANIKYLDSLWITDSDLEEIHIDGSEEGIGAHGGIYTSTVSEDKRFNSLREVSLRYCYCLRELTWLILLPNLAHLHVGFCEEMEEIISDEKLGKVVGMPQDIPPFSALVTLVLEILPRLKCIYQKPLAFPFLKEVRVDGCPKLKKLPLDRNSGKGCKIELKAEKDWWEAIEWEDKAAKAVLLPRFN